MRTTVQPEAPTASPAPREQSTSSILIAEVMRDLDDGRPTLIAATGSNLGDLRETSPARLRDMVTEARAKLNDIERLANEFEASATPRAAEAPAAWTFTHSQTEESIPVTCMPGCVLDHRLDVETPTHPTDVYCWTDSDGDATLPIDPNTGTAVDFTVLATRIEVDPFSPVIGRRLPHAVVELIDEHYVAPLDPDVFELVINLLADRVSAMRQKHAELVQIRAAYCRRQA